jgi:hypothetical protein
LPTEEEINRMDSVKEIEEVLIKIKQVKDLHHDDPEYVFFLECTIEYATKERLEIAKTLETHNIH